MLRYVPRSTESADFPCPDGMSPALHKLLMARGIASEEAARRFLRPDAHDLHDPFLLNDMSAAVARIHRAMAAGEVICVYGDYDVDGVCASAILSGYLKSHGADARVYLPSRHNEGYGLNEHAIREIAGWARLMVTVDCGVTSVALVALAKELGLDVIVTDHHRPAEELPDCPVVNPLLGGYPFPFLCGAGVAWKLAWALSGEGGALEADASLDSLPPTARAWVDVAALATVADVVSLTDENRVIVRLGLERINRSARTGIAALIDAAGLNGRRVTSTSIAFQLAPRLNAGGRLGSAMRALELVSAEDPEDAVRLATELDGENASRKQIEQQILREAEDLLAGFDFPAHRALILAGKDWNAGVIGLAASRLVEKYHYPVVMLADQGDHMTGSCRSIPGVDIHAALCGCAAHLVKFGGHKQAAGLTLLPEALDGFRAAMDAWLTENVDPNAYIPVQEYDTEVDFEEITPGFIASLEGLQPTGFGNPAPVFRTAATVVEARAVGAEGAHLKLTLAQGGHRMGGIAFQEGPRADRLSQSLDLLFVPKLNTFMGRTEVQAEVRAMNDAGASESLTAKLDDELRIQCEFLTEILYNRKTSSKWAECPEIDAGALREWLARSPQGTLVIAGSERAAIRLLEALAPSTPDVCVGALPEDPRAFNALCVCPPMGEIPGGYRRIVLAGVPSDALPEAEGVQAFALSGVGEAWDFLPDLNAMRDAYVAMMRVGQRPAWCGSLLQLARMTAEEAGQDARTALVSLLVMADMGLIELTLSPFGVRRSAVKKADPEKSALWQRVQRWRS